LVLGAHVAPHGGDPFNRAPVIFELGDAEVDGQALAVFVDSDFTRDKTRTVGTRPDRRLPFCPSQQKGSKKWLFYCFSTLVQNYGL